jgi:hypothetical protein
MSGLDTLRGMGKRRVPQPFHPREQDTAAPALMGEGSGPALVEDSAVLPELNTELDITFPSPEVPHSTRNTATRRAGATGRPTTATRRAAPESEPDAGARAGGTATRAYQHRDEEQVNLGVRVPRELDNRLLGLVYQLRMQGVRVSKAELVAMALQELPEDATPAFVRKVERRQ